MFSFGNKSGFKATPSASTAPQQPMYQQGQQGYGTTTYQPANYQPQQAQQPQSFLDKTGQFFTEIGNDIQKVFTGEESKELKMTKSSLLEEQPQDLKPKATYGTGQKKFAKKAALSPAKKFMKVTSGKAQASQAEENALTEKLDASMIEEFKQGLEDKDWKVKVRAIRGLELCGNTFGFDDIYSVKPAITSLTGAPQLSLKTAANNFLQVLNDARTGVIKITPPQPTQQVEEVAKPSDEVISFE